MAERKRRTDCTSQEAKNIHAKQQREDPRHDVVQCWDCCFQCFFDSAATYYNDDVLGLPHVH